jgi:subtilisin-like proprotein convertase family protein
MLKKLLTLLLVATLLATAQAQSLWTDVAESALPAAGERLIQPSKFRSVRLDVSALRPLLAAAPQRFSPAAESNQRPILSIPLPEGGFARFELEETPVMHPELQEKYPETRTYTGRGIDDPTAMLKCDLTPWGFHGMVRSALRGSYFIDPAIHGNADYYVVYHKKDYLRKKEDHSWTCEVPNPDGAAELLHEHEQPAFGGAEQGDTKLRRYRLALACTGEYAQFHGGTVPLVLAAMNTSMNRVNGLYETDFAVTMQIIPNNNLLVFLNGATDPYSNGNGGAMLGQNQTTCNNVIGAANYDIGHVFSTGGGGIAGLNVVCGTSKANGVTGQGSPIGDPFDIDYVAHEMGHQFGGNHTFNNCGGNNNQISAVEPGSGTTIMAYAGICGAQNVQSNSDDFFHGYNILEMGAFIYTGGANTCAEKITTANHNPDVNAGPNRTIPKSTPFALTAIGSDIDGDTLTYCWEQIDPGNAPSPPSPSATTGPLFRSFKGTTSPTRVFPRLQDLVNNVNPTWEELPGVARTMNFRVTLRDNDWQAGCTDEDDVTITVAGNSGPFVVTSPNTNVQWFVGSNQTVTWDVANTTLAPVSCANVRITLSTDGGFTYPVELAASVPNNGSTSIVVPNNVSNNCRVRVEAVGNVFFDISNTNFRIELPPAPTFLLGTSSNDVNACAGATTSFTTSMTSVSGFTDPVTLTVSGAPAGATVNVAPNPVTPTGTATISLSDITPAMAGNYTLTITATGGSVTRTATVSLAVLPGAPGQSAAVSPADGESGIGSTANLSWSSADYAGSYLVEVATNPSFSPVSIVSSQTVGGTSASVAGLAIETVYYWRIRASNDCATGDYSATFAFQTGKTTCNQNFSSTDVPKTIPVAAVVNPVVSNLNVPVNKTIGDVNVSMTVNHTWVGDILAWVISPANDTVLLFDQPGVPANSVGCSGDNALLTFDSEAAQTPDVLENQCNPAPPALNGTFQSIQSLSAFNGSNAQGQWRLFIGDNYPDEDGGALTAWSLSFCFPDVIAAGSLIANNPLSVLSAQSGDVTQSLLAMTLSGSSAQGVYMLLSVPAHGTLALNGTPLGVGDTFTQADINNGDVTYTNNGDAATSDSFLFDALDQNNDAWVHGSTFVINIISNNLAATAAVTTGIDCNGDAGGAITVNASGLDGNYTYSLNGGPGQSSNVFTGLGAGDYTVVVTGQFGFTVSVGPITLDEPAAITVNTSVADDDVTVTAAGGTGALEYSINGTSYQSSNEFLDLPNGIYTVTVRDENGCTATAEAIVAVNSLLVNVVVQTTIDCAGDDNGSLLVTVGGGVPPLTYSLNGGPGQSSNVFDNLPAGSYTVVVTDDLGLSATSSVVVLDDPDPIVATTMVVLNAINVNASGGTGNLEYSLDGSTYQASNIFGGLSNGPYTITVRDENGCTATTQATVNVTALSGTVEAPAIPCFGDVTSVVVTANNGIPPYEYRLDNGAYQSSSTFNGVAAGTHTVSIRDASGTVFLVGPFTLNQPPALVATVVVTGNDGMLGFSGGTAPYTYTTDAPNIDLQNLPNGTYNVTVSDNNACTATTSFTINVPPLSLNFVATNIACNGGNTGSITVTGAGGIPPYEYSLDGGPFQSNNMFPNLGAGTYTVTVRDADGSQTIVPVTLTQPPALTLTATVNSNSITATAQGGTPGYLYSLNGGAPQAGGTFSNLSPGQYTVVVTDQNGCTASVANLIVMTGTVEPAAAWGLNISPNPGSGLFVVTLQNAPAALRAEVFDATGRLLRSLDWQSANGQFNTTLDLQHYPNGVYFLRLNDGKNQGGVRLIKQ